MRSAEIVLFFFFNDTATTEIYTLSLHDALPISDARRGPRRRRAGTPRDVRGTPRARRGDRKSTRLNSSHQIISYAVFCLKKKKHTTLTYPTRPYTYALWLTGIRTQPCSEVSRNR